MKTLYTIRKVRILSDIQYGSYHGSDDGINTICGIPIEGDSWWITDNTFTGIITCKKCLEILKNKSVIPERL